MPSGKVGTHAVDAVRARGAHEYEGGHASQMSVGIASMGNASGRCLHMA